MTLGSVSFLVFLVGLVAGVLFSDLFAVQEVVIVSPDESLQAEAAERAESLNFGTIWLPPTRAIEARVGGLPRALEARIERKLPSTLLIRVESRQPVAFAANEGRYMAVDAEGVYLHWTGAPFDDMPTIQIAEAGSMEVGGHLSDEDLALMWALMEGLAKTQLLAEASIDISHPLRITVFTGDGVLGKLGNEEMLYEKTVLFGRLLKALLDDGETPLYIDLRVPERPTYRRID